MNGPGSGVQGPGSRPPGGAGGNLAKYPLCVLSVLCGFVFSGCSGAPRQPDAEKARVYLEQGRSAAEKGNHAAAVEIYTKAIHENPEYPEAYCGRGYSNVKLRLDPNAASSAREYEDRALADYGLALRYNPALADAYFNRAMLLASRGQYKPAAEDLLNAIKYKDRDPEPHFHLARIYEEKFEERLSAAMDHYEKYADLGGTDPEVREKVRLWKQLKAQAGAPSTKAPTPEEEKKAGELHEEFKRLFAANKKDEALKAVEELVTKYGHTQFVQRRARELNVLLDALKKAPK
jgi:tetratricopeptide (TPR) repeat protein